jgi:hypothetical protein
LAFQTDGKVFSEEVDSLKNVVENGEIFRPLPVTNFSLQTIWFWLVVLGGICLFFDVAVRRISIETEKVTAEAIRWWEKIRGRAPLPEATAQFLDRLRSKKAEAGETIDKTKAVKRFEARESMASVAVPEATVSDAPIPGKGAPVLKKSMGPEKEKEAGDFASRLLRAKKKAMEEREKEKGI